MGIIHDILKEEYSRLQRLKDRYVKELDSLPRGAISRKKIRRNEYYYLAYRMADKVKFDYLGKKSSPRLREIETQIAKRKEIERKLRQVKGNMKEIGKSLHGQK